MQESTNRIIECPVMSKHSASLCSKLDGELPYTTIKHKKTNRDQKRNLHQDKWPLIKIHQSYKLYGILTGCLGAVHFSGLS